AQRLDPGDQRWWHLSGGLLLLSQPDRAVGDLRQSVRVATNAVSAEISRFALGRGLLELGREGEAAEELLALLRGNTNHAGARLEMARIEVSHDHWTNAEQLLSLCVSNHYTVRPAILLVAQM